MGETLCSLNFASRVRGIELGPAKKQFDCGENFKNKQLVEKVKQEIRNKELQIKNMEDMVCSVESKNKAKDLLNRNLQEKIKELESQLLIERKLARQHVDSKIAEDHHLQEQKQLDFNNTLNYDPPPSYKPQPEKTRSPADQRSILRPISENNNHSSPDSTVVRYLNPTKDKENKPAIDENTFSTKTSRFSLENAIPRISLTPFSRRDSMIPPPAVRTMPLVCLPPQFPHSAVDITSNGRQFGHGGIKRSSKSNSILRRSLQKKLIIRSPLPQGGGIGNAAGEKLRVSIGNRGWRTRRAPGTDAATTGRGVQQKRQHKEKERGWSTGKY